MHGSIFEIPAADHSFDGIYNLGVMEHFTEPEIQKILTEFKRVVKPGGKIVLFWPPDFGFSVNLFKAIKFVAEKFFGKRDIKFHPDEVSRIQSKSHAERLISEGGFEIERYAFGPRDMFTQVMIVASPRQGLSSEQVSFTKVVANGA